MRVNLFISSFRKYKRGIGAVIAFLAFAVVFSISHKALWYLLVDDTNSYTRITLHEMYHQQENIDVLFLGSSHCYRSLDTSVTDRLFEANTFNGGSSSQNWDGSFALLQEAGKQYQLKKVYVEMYCHMAGRNYKERSDLTSTYLISDYMKPSFTRVRYLINASSPEYWIHGFFPERRNWHKLFERLYVSGLIKKKSSDSYKNYGYVGNPDTDEEYYAGKGFVASRKFIEKEGYVKNTHSDSVAKTFSEDDITSLRNIIEYCRKHEIELCFFSAPMPDIVLVDAGEYDSYVTYVTDFFKGYDVPYYDFNLCKADYFSYDSSLFKDMEHLNMYGAAQFSEVFSKFFTGKINAEDLFYPSYQDKLNAAGDWLYGLVYQLKVAEEEKTFTFEVIQNGEVDYKASIYKKIEGEEEYVLIQEKDSLKPVSLPAEETGQLCISIFQKGCGEEPTNEVVIPY